MRKLKVNQGEMLRQILAKNNDVKVIETSMIGKDMVLETLLVNDELRLVIVSDTEEAVVVT